MPDKYALIIGIENYPEKSGQGKVLFALNDAKAMAEYARAAGFHLIGDRPILDENASYSEVIRLLDHMFHYVGGESFVLLYYAGHGYYSEYGGYLIPFDFQQNKGINESSCISFNSINLRIQRKKPDRFVFFLDTCHSGYAGKQIDIRRASLKDIAVTAKTREKISKEIKDMVQEQGEAGNIGRAVFTSSGPDEKSTVIQEKQHGLFTYYLLSGLKRKGYGKEVNIEELIRYVKEQVIRYALNHHLKQTPTAYTNIQGKLFLPVYKSRDEEEIIIGVPDLKDSIGKVRKALEANDYDGAEKLLLRILEEDNLNFEANRLLEDLEDKREKDRIEKEKKKREVFEEWKKRGENFLQSGEYAKAKECFENAGKICPDSEIIQAFLAGMELKRQIIKIDDIEVPGGGKMAVLKELFSDAEELVSKKEYTKALNHYNKILKIYPGNTRAIKEKVLLYEKWLNDYEREVRHFEMLGILEDVILEDKTIIAIENKFSKIYDETLLAYAEEFIKARFNQELSVKKRELVKKEELIRRYADVLSDYEELAMEKEYNELKKVLGRLKREAEPLNAEVKRYNELLNSQLFSKSNIDETVKILRNIIDEGVKDEYLQKALRPIGNRKQEYLFKEVKILPEETYEQIIYKIEKFKTVICQVSGSIREKILNYELKELERNKKRKFEELENRKALERVISRKNEEESFKKGLIKTIFNISLILFLIECAILNPNITTGRGITNILGDLWDLTSYIICSLAILISMIYACHISYFRIYNIFWSFWLIFFILFTLWGFGFIIVFITFIIKLFSKEYTHFLLEKFIPAYLIYCIPIFPFVTILISSLIVKLTGKRYNAWFAFIPHILLILFILRKFIFP